MMSKLITRFPYKPCFRRACFSSRTNHWFRRFLSPKEEKELYLGITSSFREKLIEQANKNTQTYSNIIETALMSTKKQGVLSVQRIEELKVELDEAGKNKDVTKLEQLESEMDMAQLKIVTIYNRLIRSYLSSNRLDLAVSVLDQLESKGILPSTRSYTYLIKAYLKNNQLSKARQLVEHMQHLSLNRLRTSFDCSVMLKYYIACGDHHAIDYLWRDVSQYSSSIKPGISLYTQYMEYLISRKDTKSIVQTLQDIMQLEIPSFTAYHYSTWIQAVPLLTSNVSTTQQAEQLLIYIIKQSPRKIIGWESIKTSISDLITSYIHQGKELRALAFYYRLRKLHVPDETFDQTQIDSIAHILDRSETRHGIDAEEETKALLNEFKGLLIK
ncbi:hypothetical protein BDB01DRAFT_789560 [Pilobolus umbonatus]|nr:hypothetical protein BDB01DRAFT_789560 [Pilobolus umbonatus]